jgi:DNA-binding NarL/FixJ family response regulator
MAVRIHSRIVYEGRDLVYAALKAGVVGYLLKSVGVLELDAALQEFAEGGVPMSARIARRLLRDLVDGVGKPQNS